MSPLDTYRKLIDVSQSLYLSERDRSLSRIDFAKMNPE
jgi:hypothetical protein